MSDRNRARALRLAGIAIILLSAGAMLLPAGKRISSDMIGALLIAAGLIELVAGSLRREVRPFAMTAGGATTLAGLIFVVNRESHFFPTVILVIAWLLVRSVILAAATLEAAGSVRIWTALSAGMDLLLAVLLIAGLLGGMVGLAWIETRRGQPGAYDPRPLDVAMMLAAGLGLYSFAKGLTVGQSMATALQGPGTLVVLGVALQGLIAGAVVAAPVVGQPMSPSRLFLLAAIVAGPSVGGIIVGTSWVGPGLELLVLSLAAGTLIYVLRELLRGRLEDVSAVGAMWGLAAGLLLALAAELLVELGRQS